jgi:predicted molibdopterin-dependent oxidoreductase YjgC
MTRQEETPMTARQATNRIADHPVLGEIPRQEPVRVLFDGEPLQALAGESIATTLRAHGISISRTMPETGSPRGFFCGVGRCPDCMMTVDRVLNVRACVTPVHDGMVIETQRELGTWKVRD